MIGIWNSLQIFAVITKCFHKLQGAWILDLITWFQIQDSSLTSCREPAYCILSAALFTASSFRIWNSSTGILSLPGASVRNSAHDIGHEEGGSAYTKVGWSLRSLFENFWASTPKIRVCLLFVLCSPLHLWLYRGLSPTTSLWKKELTYSSS